MSLFLQEAGGEQPGDISPIVLRNEKVIKGVTACMSANNRVLLYGGTDFERTTLLNHLKKLYDEDVNNPDIECMVVDCDNLGTNPLQDMIISLEEEFKYYLQNDSLQKNRVLGTLAIRSKFSEEF